MTVDVNPADNVAPVAAPVSGIEGSVGRRVSDNYTTTGQLTPAQIQQAVDQGFQAVLNLRGADEAGVLVGEDHQVATVGLAYAHAPVSSTVAVAESLEQALTALAALPKPVLIHCRSGGRATVLALIATAQQNNLSQAQFIAQVQAQGLSLEQPHIQHFLQTHPWPSSDSV